MQIFYTTKPAIALSIKKLEWIQYNVCLGLTWASRGFSKEKIHEGPHFESLRVLRWYRKVWFYIILNNEHTQYLFNLIPVIRTFYSTRNAVNIPNTNGSFLKNSFFPFTIIEWNKLDPALEKQIVCRFLRLIFISSYGLLQTLSTIAIILKDVNLFARLRLGLMYLREHELKHRFQDTINL